MGRGAHALRREIDLARILFDVGQELRAVFAGKSFLTSSTFGIFAISTTGSNTAGSKLTLLNSSLMTVMGAGCEAIRV